MIHDVEYKVEKKTLDRFSFHDGLIIGQAILSNAESLEHAKTELDYIRTCVESQYAEELVENVSEDFMLFNMFNHGKTVSQKGLT